MKTCFQLDQILPGSAVKTLNDMAARLRTLILAITFTACLCSTMVGNEASWPAMIQAGDQFMNQSRFTQAAEAFRSATVQARASGGPGQIAVSLDRLSSADVMLGRKQDAEMSLREAIRCLESTERAPHPFLISLWADLGGLYLDMRQYERARNVVERAEKALSHQPAPHPTEAALVLSLLAAIDNSQHKTDDAEARWKQAITVLDGAGLGQSSGWISVANNLGTLLFVAGRREEGGRYLREALSRGEAALRSPAEKLVLGRVLTNLAELNFGLQRFEEAEGFLVRALEIFEIHLGPTHFVTGDALMQYAALCRATNRKAAAKNYERRAQKCVIASPNGSQAFTIDVSELRERRR